MAARRPVVPLQSGQFMGGGAAATLDILRQVQEAGTQEAFRKTVHVKDDALAAISVSANDAWGEEEESEPEDTGIRGRVARVVETVAHSQWLDQQRQAQAAAQAHLELSMPLAHRAAHFRMRAERRVAADCEARDAAEALAAEAADSRPTDFDFNAPPRPHRMACGRASRIGREVARTLTSQVREGRLELVRNGENVRPRYPPVAGLEATGPLALPQVRYAFRDFALEWTRDNALHYQGEPGGWRDGGLRVASLGCGGLLLELELLERVRGLGVRVGQVCIVDSAYVWPNNDAKRALQEFADIQRAAAMLARQEPAEILVFGHASEFASQRGCHLMLHCESCVSEDECDRLAMKTLVHGGMLARLTNLSASAWSLSPGGPAVQGGVDLKGLSDPLLAACTMAMSSPAVQTKLQVQAFARAQQAAAAPPEEPEEDKGDAEAKAKEADRAKGLSEAQVLARARMRARGGGEASATKTIRKTAMQERAAHYGLEVYRVIHKPHVAVRAAPKGTAKIVAQLDFGQELMASKDRKGHWLRISEGPVTSNLPTDAWVLVDASEGLGISMMLEKVDL